jgi:hypothetical protein
VVSKDKEKSYSEAEIDQKTRSSKKRNKQFICNFRAPDKEHYQRWQKLKRQVKKQGLDNCHVLFSLIDAWLRGHSVIACTNQHVNLTQNNYFNYNVQKPRREPHLLCSRKGNKRTINSVYVQDHIMEKAREL